MSRWTSLGLVGCEHLRSRTQKARVSYMGGAVRLSHLLSRQFESVRPFLSSSTGSNVAVPTGPPSAAAFGSQLSLQRNKQSLPGASCSLPCWQVIYMQMCLSEATEAHKHDNSSFSRSWDGMEGGERPSSFCGRS